MNGSVSAVFFLVFFLFLSFCEANLRSVVNAHENVRSLDYSKHYANESISEVNAMLYKTANKYYCNYKRVENPELIIYGTKSWSFPKQNVNLTLSYPTQSDPEPTGDPKQTYIITGFNVILFVDANDSQGFITRGGILEDSISLTFVCSNVSMLVYEFWLYGIPKDTPRYEEVAASGLRPVTNDMCAPEVP